MLETLGRWFGRKPRRHCLPRLDWDQYLLADGRRCPSDVQRRIQELDPTALLIYIGEGKWMLGLQTGSSKVRAAGQREYETELNNEVSRARSVELELAQLKVRGIQPQWLYEQPEPDGRIVNHFRAMLWVERNAVASVTRQALDASELNLMNLEERKARMLDAVISKGADAMRYRKRYDGTQRRSNFLVRRVGA